VARGNGAVAGVVEAWTAVVGTEAGVVGTGAGVVGPGAGVVGTWLGVAEPDGLAGPEEPGDAVDGAVVGE
jgi:hypothetical protein